MKSIFDTILFFEAFGDLNEAAKGLSNWAELQGRRGENWDLETTQVENFGKNARLSIGTSKCLHTRTKSEKNRDYSLKHWNRLWESSRNYGLRSFSAVLCQSQSVNNQCWLEWPSWFLLCIVRPPSAIASGNFGKNKDLLLTGPVSYARHTWGHTVKS